jgi:hypothetical protein
MHVSTALQYIGERAFGDCQALISFDMPAGVTTIGIGAFINDQQLKSIVIPEGITNIYADTFRQCYALESVTLPDSLQVIGSCAFMYCMSLTLDFWGTAPFTFAVRLHGQTSMAPFPPSNGPASGTFLTLLPPDLRSITT